MTDHYSYLKRQLQPLRVYSFDGTFIDAELRALGQALDTCATAIDSALGKLSDVSIGYGMHMYAQLFPELAQSIGAENMAGFIKALMTAPAMVMTKDNINTLLSMMGLEAQAWENAEPFTVEIASSNELPQAVKAAIEKILPCHLAVSYVVR